MVLVLCLNNTSLFFLLYYNNDKSGHYWTEIIYYYLFSKHQNKLYTETLENVSLPRGLKCRPFCLLILWTLMGQNLVCVGPVLSKTLLCMATEGMGFLSQHPLELQYLNCKVSSRNCNQFENLGKKDTIGKHQRKW